MAGSHRGVGIKSTSSRLDSTQILTHDKANILKYIRVRHTKFQMSSIRVISDLKLSDFKVSSWQQIFRHFFGTTLTSKSILHDRHYKKCLKIYGFLRDYQLYSLFQLLSFIPGYLSQSTRRYSIYHAD